MKELSKFQLIVFGSFILAIFVAVIVLASFRASGGGDELRPVVIWGTMTADRFDPFLTVGTNERSVNASYVYKKSATLYQELLEALASGQGPDILFVTQEELFQVRSKIATIPFSSFPERTYRDSFSEGTEIFLNQQGIEAFPALVDPIVMYWNRDIVTSNNYVSPPKTWDEFLAFAERVSKHNAQLEITRSAVPFGEFKNVSNAKDILHTLIYQAGGKITSRTDVGFTSTLFNTPQGTKLNPAAAIFDYFMQFSDPQKPTYSWNRTLSSSKDMFISGDLAIYFGYASEVDEIRAKNPNLNFDVAFVPQTRGSDVPMTHGKFYAFTLVRIASIQDGVALADVNVLTQPQTIARVIGRNDYFPVRRDLLSVQQPRADKSTFYTSALFARSWIDPNPTQTNTIFSEIVSMISSGRLTTLEAIDRANAQIEKLLK